MAKIKVLDKQVAELIAAGEVVERPSSVIKELVENAVDAGASIITVEIQNGGVTYMRVTDNGCGIPAEEVPVAFLRHATSKVKGEADLASIGTLGFRGEALASISAVARVELLTKEAAAENGCRYTVAGGVPGELEPAGCPDGTTILIRDLFYNIPARMKFLKKDVTEGNAVAGIVDKVALSHPEISLRFIRDGKEQLRTPGDNQLSSAIYAVFGKAFSENLIPVAYEHHGITVSGFISAPAGARANRSMQNFFINGRYIKSRTAGVALDEAFKGSVLVGKFAACVLNLTMPLDCVDVNVHPAKLEVRFINEKPVFDAVYHGVKTALRKGDGPKSLKLPVRDQPPQGRPPVQTWLTPQESGGQSGQEIQRRASLSALLDGEGEPAPAAQQPFFSSTPVARDSGPIMTVPVLPRQPAPRREMPQAAESLPHGRQAGEAETVVPPQENEAQATVGVRPLAEEQEGRTRVIGEAFSTYIIVQRGSGELLLIDKHAAHERILYEELRAKKQEAAAQLLLEPVSVSLEKAEYDAVLANQVLLDTAGFAVEDFGPGVVLVRSCPLALTGADAAASLMEIAGHLVQQKTAISTAHLDFIYHNVACKAAMKGGDKRAPEELLALVKMLEANPEIRYCPHGRPVSMVLSRTELEKQFGRIQG